MGYGYHRTLEVYDGMRKYVIYTYDDNDNKVLGSEMREFWWEVQRFEDGDRMVARAIAQSKKFPEDLFRTSFTTGYTLPETKEHYYKAGEMIAYRFSKRNTSRSSDIEEWAGDPRPELPAVKAISVEKFWFDEVELKIKSKIELAHSWSEAALTYKFVGRGWRFERVYAKAVLNDGRALYFDNGKQVDSLQPTFDFWLKVANYRETLIVPSKNTNISSATIDSNTFKTPDIHRVLAGLVSVSNVFNAAAIEAINEQDRMSHIAARLTDLVNELKETAKGWTNEVDN